MRTTPRRFLLLVLGTIALAGCGGGDEQARPLAADTLAPAMPGQRISPDSLYGATATEITRVVPVEVEIDGLPVGWDGMQIAVLSDFQLGLWADNEVVAEAAVRKAAESGAELFVLLGDYVAGNDALSTLEQVLAPLADRPTIAVLGDRDIRTDSLEARVSRTLRGLGAVVLDNTSAPFERDGDTIYIAGLAPDFGLLPEWRRAELARTVGSAPVTPILLTHLPETVGMTTVGPFALALAGHTFCGEVDVPGTPRLSRLRSEIFPDAASEESARLFRMDGSRLLITCGLGYSFVPVRLGAPPEVLLLTLRASGGEAEQTPADTALGDGGGEGGDPM